METCTLVQNVIVYSPTAWYTLEPVHMDMILLQCLATLYQTKFRCDFILLFQCYKNAKREKRGAEPYPPRRDIVLSSSEPYIETQQTQQMQVKPSERSTHAEDLKAKVQHLHEHLTSTLRATLSDLAEVKEANANVAASLGKQTLMTSQANEKLAACQSDIQSYESTLSEKSAEVAKLFEDFESDLSSCKSKLANAEQTGQELSSLLRRYETIIPDLAAYERVFKSTNLVLRYSC